MSVAVIRELADELGIEPSPVRYTNKPAPADSLNVITAIIGDAEDVVGARSPSLRGPMSVGAMRDQLRAVGIDLGHQREDAEDFESTCRHEAGHAVVAHGLGWDVVYVDARAGETKIEPPDYQEQSYTDRLRQHNAIAAAGSVAAGTSSSRDENENDRVAVRMSAKGADFNGARKLAEKLLADRWAKPALERLTRALLVVGGRLEGDALRAVLEDE